MKNKVIHDGNEVRIIARSKGEEFVARVSKSDWEKVSSIPTNWRVLPNYDPDNHMFYAQFDYDGQGKARRIYLHRYILDLRGKEFVVYFEDGDPLNCTRENMRVISRRECGIISKEPGVGEKKKACWGVRGVTYFRKYDKYKAYINFSGRQEFLGYYDTVEEASEVVEACRKDIGLD